MMYRRTCSDCAELLAAASRLEKGAPASCEESLCEAREVCEQCEARSSRGSQRAACEAHKERGWETFYAKKAPGGLRRACHWTCRTAHWPPCHRCGRRPQPVTAATSTGEIRRAQILSPAAERACSTNAQCGNAVAEPPELIRAPARQSCRCGEAAACSCSRTK